MLSRPGTHQARLVGVVGAVGNLAFQPERNVMNGILRKSDSDTGKQGYGGCVPPPLSERNMNGTERTTPYPIGPQPLTVLRTE